LLEKNQPLSHWEAHTHNSNRNRQFNLEVVNFQLESANTHKDSSNPNFLLRIRGCRARGCPRFMTEAATLSTDPTPLQNQLNCDEAENDALNSDLWRVITSCALLL
jgi:hypothetical protein